MSPQSPQTPSFLRQCYTRYIHNVSLVVYSLFGLAIVCMITAIKAIIGYQEIQIAIKSKKDAITALHNRRMYEKQFVIPYYTSEYARYFAAHEYGKLADNEAIIIPPVINQSGGRETSSPTNIKPYIIQDNLPNYRLWQLWIQSYTTTHQK